MKRCVDVSFVPVRPSVRSFVRSLVSINQSAHHRVNVSVRPSFASSRTEVAHEKVLQTARSIGSMDAEVTNHEPSFQEWVLPDYIVRWKKRDHFENAIVAFGGLIE